MQGITGLEMGIELIADKTGNAPASLRGSAADSLIRVPVVARTEQVDEIYASSFLLDWLSGGEACQRDIQGFSFKFEVLNPAVGN